MFSRPKNFRASFIILTAALAIGACKDTTDPEPEPEVVTMRLTIGTTNPQTVTVANNGAVTGGPITIPVNTPTSVTAVFLRADGTEDPIAMTDEFQLNLVELTPSTITFTRTSNFVLSLTATATTTTGSGKFGLFHIEEGHFDWGEWPIPIVVAQ